ncbi:MAG: hypothetical protein IPM64_10385 [Phycisphaerales bacterium]|nr:hypothetical protein [Phycisphaerales bacterium]
MHAPRRTAPDPCRLLRAAALALTIALLPSAVAGEHPCLFLGPEDLPRIRHAAGIGPASPDAGRNRYAALAADYHALRVAIRDSSIEAPLPGDLLGCAFLTMIDPQSPEHAARLARLKSWISRPDPVAADLLSLVLALDWSWNHLPDDVRRDALTALRAQAKPLPSTDSPLRRDAFLARLADLAMAIAVDEADEPAQAWAQIRGELIQSARQYARDTLPRFLALRGMAPTSPSSAADEEAGIVLFAELIATLDAREPDVERERGDPREGGVGLSSKAVQPNEVSRLLEHYALIADDAGRAQRQFVRDDGDDAPLLTCERWERLTPLTAHLLARRSHDPAAVWMALRVERELRARPERAGWRFVPLLCDLREERPAVLDALPIVRDLGSAVVFRSRCSDVPVVIWVEAPTAHLRSRQYFDAGHFLIRRGGDLVATAAVDVAHEAVAAKGGAQYAGAESEPAAMTQFSAATIAHNAMIFFESGRTPVHEGQRYRPLGGQRPISGDWRDFGATSDGPNPRRLGGLLAAGEVNGAGYAALDLAPAYSSGAVSAYVREFVWLPPDALVVIDRFQLRDAGTIPTWVMQLPTRPRALRGELSDRNRATGGTNEAGVWILEAPGVEWSESDGRAALQVLHPASVRFRVVGGPAQRLTIEDGPHAGRTYVGGSQASFERLLTPFGSRSAVNAWFRLGAAARLGPEFGLVPHWGRVEVEPVSKGLEHTLIHVVHVGGIAGDLSVGECAKIPDGRLQVQVRAAERLWTLRIREGAQRGGEIAAGAQPVRADGSDNEPAEAVLFAPLPESRERGAALSKRAAEPN